MTVSSRTLFDTVLQQLGLDLAPWQGQGLSVRAPRDGAVDAAGTPADGQVAIAVVRFETCRGR